MKEMQLRINDEFLAEQSGLKREIQQLKIVNSDLEGKCSGLRSQISQLEEKLEKEGVKNAQNGGYQGVLGGQQQRNHYEGSKNEQKIGYDGYQQQNKNIDQEYGYQQKQQQKQLSESKSYQQVGNEQVQMRQQYQAQLVPVQPQIGYQSGYYGGEGNNYQKQAPLQSTMNQSQMKTQQYQYQENPFGGRQMTPNVNNADLAASRLSSSRANVDQILQKYQQSFGANRPQTPVFQQPALYTPLEYKPYISPPKQVNMSSSTMSLMQKYLKK